MPKRNPPSPPNLRTDALRRELAEVAHLLRTHLRAQQVLEAEGLPPTPRAWEGWQAETVVIDDVEWETSVGRRSLPSELRQDAAPPPPVRREIDRVVAAIEMSAPKPPVASGLSQISAIFKDSLSLGAGPAPIVATPSSERPESLESVWEELGDCRRCGLCEGRQRIVFGVGDPNARLVLIGDAPEAIDEEKGEPFASPAGELLDRILTKGMGLSRSDVYLCNILMCRPPEDRPPNVAEVTACEPFLEKQLERVRPEAIITLGRIAARALLKETTPLTRLRGQWREYRGIPVMPTLHPAFLLRNPASKRLVWADVQQVMRRLGLSA